MAGQVRKLCNRYIKGDSESKKKRAKLTPFKMTLRVFLTPPVHMTIFFIL